MKLHGQLGAGHNQGSGRHLSDPLPAMRRISGFRPTTTLKLLLVPNDQPCR